MRTPNLVRILCHITRHPLNRGRKSATVRDFIKWQISSRLAPGAIIYPWINGTRLVARPGETAVSSNIYMGLSEFSDMTYLLHTLKPEDLFIDVGANVGIYTVLACGVRGARAVSFEPVPSIFQRLQENIGLNNLEARVKALNIGVADKDGELTFTAGMGQHNHVLAAGETQRDVITVPVRTLDSVLAGERPAVMKIDVEGFEASVLAGGGGVLREPTLHSVIMEINECSDRYGVTRTDLVTTMKSYGFSEFEYDPFTRKLTQIPAEARHGLNTLFVRDAALAAARIAAAPRVSIRGFEL